MDEPSLEQMMNFMLEGKKQSFFISIILFLIILVIVLIILFIIDRFIVRTNNLKLFRVSIIVLLICHLFILGSNLYIYKNGIKNQSPWRVGIYEAYYECNNCKSLAGGIFGKEPTKWLILNKNCIHEWQAIYKLEFERNFIKREKLKIE